MTPTDAETSTAGYSDRIELARTRGPRPMSVRELATRMGENHGDIRGSSYGGVRQYAAGEVENPRIELLRAMADVLGVREDWLAFAEGNMTSLSQKLNHGDTVVDAHLAEVRNHLGPKYESLVDIPAVAAEVAYTLEALNGTPAGLDLVLRGRTSKAVADVLRATLEAADLTPAVLLQHTAVEYAKASLAGLRRVTGFNAHRMPDSNQAGTDGS